MGWMARAPERRADPREVLAGARSVISVAASYYRGDPPPEASGAPALSGRIARYAWGRDYHRRLRRRLRALGAALRSLAPGARWLAYVDTGPVLDRGWAEQAGIGWIGKNTNVILARSGSWFFLGEILTNLELPPARPARNHCGRCARCIPACPTGAIVAPYQLDAQRCISYLTIENRGAIPLELRPSIGTRIFGCDDCQEVCPWNRFAVPATHPDFAEREGQQTPDLLPLLALDEETFRARFQGTALLRAQRSGLARNVAVALGNLGDPRAIPALAAAVARDPSALVRSHAAWALGRIGGDTARAALASAAAREEDLTVREEIEQALAASAMAAAPAGSHAGDAGGIDAPAPARYARSRSSGRRRRENP
jgi:epoxyqueuosine reductase